MLTVIKEISKKADSEIPENPDFSPLLIGEYCALYGFALYSIATVSTWLRVLRNEFFTFQKSPNNIKMTNPIPQTHYQP